MKQQLITMLDLQDDMNTKVHESWREQNFEWYRAIWVECAELLDHYGWKWWKKQQPDLEQIKLELVDIWHFGLSTLLLSGDSHEQIAQSVETQFEQATSARDFRLDLEQFTLNTLSSRQFDAAGFATLMKGVDMDFNQLHTGYVGKNVLNFFRQDHGYQDGSYQKQWGGKEDNEYLVEIVADIDTADIHFKDELYKRMKSLYNELCL